MPHIQLRNGSRLFVNSTDEELWIKTGNTYTLEHVGFGRVIPRPVPTIQGANGSIAVAVVSTADDKQTFTVTARSPGTAEIFGRSASGDTTKVTIRAGVFPKHYGSYSIDLLSDVLNRPDPVRVFLIQQMLYNLPDNIFNQKNNKNKHPQHGNMACGVVAKERGNQIFSTDALDVVPQLGSPGNAPDVVCPIRYEFPYHEPLQQKVRQRSDLKYHHDTIQDVRLKMHGFLKAGRPVRVGVVDRPKVMGLHKPSDPKRKGFDLHAYDDGGHTVLIYGCNESAHEFIYLDPWGGGSKLEYKGGLVTPTRDSMCVYMGAFESKFEAGRMAPGGTSPRYNLLRQTVDSEWGFTTAGDNFLEIISGP
jgi:hypothetical protein